MANKKQTNRKQIVEAKEQDELYVISDYLKKLKFTHRVMGVDEADVWKKIEKLCELYDDALAIERGKNAKLARQLKDCTAKLKACALKLKENTNAEKTGEDKPNG